MKSRSVGALISLVLLSAAAPIAASTRSAAQSEMVVRVVYDDRIGGLFKDESWTARNEIARTTVRSGKTSMSVELDWWGGVQLHGEVVDLRGAQSLSIWMHGGTSGGQKLKVSLKVNGRSTERFVRGLDVAWQEIRLPLSEVGGAPNARGDVSVTIAGDVNDDQSTVFLDDVYFVGPANGNVRPPGNVPFPGGLVSFTFDDNAPGQNNFARPLLNAAGFRGTFFTPTQFVQPDVETGLGMLQMQRMAAEGHEIASHAVTHKDLPSLSPADLEGELQQSISFLTSGTGQKIRSFATPSGAFGAREFPYFERYFENHRTAWSGSNDVASDRYHLYTVEGGRESSKIIADIDAAVAADRWAILVFHQINETGAGFFAVSRSDLARVIEHVRSRGIPTATMIDGSERLRRPVGISTRPNSDGKPKAILTSAEAKLVPTSDPASTAAPNTQPAPAPAVPSVTPTTAPGPVQAGTLVRSSKSGLIPLFTDSFAVGVEDWSWAERTVGSANPARGKRSIAANLSDWKGLYFHGTADLRGTAAFEFWIHGGSVGGQKVQVTGKQNNAKNFTAVTLKALPKGGWTRMRIPLARLGLKPGFGVFDVQITDASGKTQTPVAIDDVSFTR